MPTSYILRIMFRIIRYKTGSLLLVRRMRKKFERSIMFKLAPLGNQHAVSRIYVVTYILKYLIFLLSVVKKN